MITSLPTQTPLPQPPPGPTYVTVVPTTLSLRLFIIIVIFDVLVLIALALRVWSRLYISIKLGLDDALVFWASFLSLGQTAIFGLLVFGGLGHVNETVPEPNQFSIPKILFSYEVIHIVALNTAKLSALAFYLKLFNSKEIAQTTKVCMIALVIGTLALFLYQFTFCHPLADMWKWDGLETCGNRKPLYVTVCGWSIFTDLLLLAVPLPAIWKLKMDRQTKIRLTCLFAIGLSVTAVSVIRLGYITTINYHNDFSYTSVSATFLANLEPLLTILCVSIPMIYTLAARVLKKEREHKFSSGAIRTPSYSYVKPGKFSQLKGPLPDPFELDNIYGNRREVLISTAGRSKLDRTKDQTITKSIDREGDSSSGSEASLVEDTRFGSPPPNGGGIMVSTDFKVEVSRS
ncbi:hypothetical protein F5Y16DRAFT_161937 [Xylariaceae sp. FL0255]|nr:hypothetical protein F5Y16DRAFT_161937 [Xylariaceae sp. FL0255]